MSDYLAFPPARGVSGTVAAPPSKSATNRALVLAALSDSAVAIVNPLESEDTRALSRCLAAMGARFETVPAGLRVGGPLAGPRNREITLDAGESGTAARFLAAVASATPGRFLLTGQDGCASGRSASSSNPCGRPAPRLNTPARRGIFR
jgi:3-phosphoshikimate 1-carboxyvinyltransferase